MPLTKVTYSMIKGAVINAFDYGVVGDGSTDDTVAIQAAINATTTSGGTLFFPAGTYKITSPVTLKNGVIYQGAGVNETGIGTKFVYTGTTDAFKILNTVNGSTAAFVSIRDIWFQSATLAADNAMIYDLASSDCSIRNCKFTVTNNGGGVILDQSELWDISECWFNCQEFGVWLVNGPDKNPSANPGYTNRISIKSSDFNNVGFGIVDDGGMAHAYRDNNYNNCTVQIRATAVNGLVIDGGEFENASGSNLYFPLTKKNGAAGVAIPNATVQNGFFYSATNPKVGVFVTNAVTSLDFSNNVLNTAVEVTPGETLNAAITTATVFAVNNIQLGAGGSGTIINNYFNNSNWTPSWGTSGTAPSLGNGTLVGEYSRKGKLVTATLKLTLGSTSTVGTGIFQFTLPVPVGTNTVPEVGSALITIGSTFYTAVCRIPAGSSVVQVIPTGAASPGAWANGDTVEAQISFTSAYPIN